MKNPKTQRVLTPWALRNSGLTVIDEYHDDKVDIIVYEDGSVDYSQHYQGCKARRTVFDLRDAEIYTSPDGFSLKYDLSNSDAFIAITIYGDEKIIRNSDKNERDNTQQFIGTEATDDFVDKWIKKLTYSDTLKQLADAIDTLTHAQKKVIFLYYYKELTEKQISEKLGIGRTSVQDCRLRSLKKLNKYFTK